MDSSAVTSELATSVAATVDAAASGRVLVLGSLPPTGRDLDILARSPERDRIERALCAAGLLRKGSDFALFRTCSAYGVELFAAEQFLPQAALDDLFAQALPLRGFRALARPAPAHALLILARLVVDDGHLQPKRRPRLERILAEDPQAWERAREAAPSWHATRALALLERAAVAGKPVPLSERLRALGPRALPLPRRGLLVALSGIDGAGKSSQARWLAESLTALGADVEVIWNDLLGNRALNLLGTPPKALLRLAGRRSERMARYDDAPPSSDAPTASAVRGIWSTIVTLANAVEQRIMATRSVGRNRVIVFDRSPLDLAVRMQVLYRANVEMQRRLVKLAAPRPDLAFLLDIPAEVSLARKSDIWLPSQLMEQTMLYRALAPRFGVRRLDGQRPPDEIAAEIGREAWLALR
ncbi:MAG: dTMP kinase [Solirubrobacterales bacterium]